MWLYAPSQSAPAAADSNSDSTLLAQDYSSLFVTVNAKPAPWKRLSTSRRRAQFPLLLSGLMCGRSAMQTAAESWAKSSASSAESPVSPIQSPGSSVAKMIRETFGPRSVATLRRLNQSSLCSSRTSQGCLLPGEPAVLSKTWSDWVSRLRQTCLQRRKSARLTSGSDCSSLRTTNGTIWPTPDACHSETRTNKGGSGGRVGPDRPVLGLYARLWHTPNVPNRGPETKQSKAKRPDAGGIDLQTEAKLWNTPHAMGNTDKTGKLGGAGGGEFAKQANEWPTPAGTEVRQGVQNRPQDKKGSQKSLTTIACQSSPQDPQTSTPGEESSKSIPASPPPSWATPAGADAIGSTGGTTEKGGGKCLRKDASRFVGTTKRRLNPRFVEWLMGWPRDWTQCSTARDGSDYSGTVLSPYRQRTRSSLLRLCCSEATE